jgi:sugar-specific transcriptional regulator TrmB
LDQIQQDDRGSDALAERMGEFGLSYDEASLFILLTRLRKSGVDWITGKELAKIANRDRVRVYQILQKLEEIGMVRADFARPTGYSAVQPETAIERLISIHEAKLTQLNNYRTDLKEALKEADPITAIPLPLGNEGQNKPAMSMSHGVSGIQHLIRDSLTGSSLRIISNSDSTDYILSTIEHAVEPPKHIKVLFSGNGANPPETLLTMRGTKLANLEASYIPGHLPTFVLTDNQVLILFYSIEKYKPKPLSSFKSRILMLHALVVSDKLYVEEMHHLFDTLWRVSVRIKPRTEVERGKS